MDKVGNERKALTGDALAVGLCCCWRSPQLLKLLVKYYGRVYRFGEGEEPLGREWREPAVTIPELLA